MKRVFCFLLSVLTILLMVSGCSSNKGQVIFVDTPAGDTIRVEFNPPNDNYRIYMSNDIMYFMTADGIQLGMAEFSNETHLKMLLSPNTIYEQKIASLEFYNGNNYQYLLITSTDKNEEYGTMGWVTGSNSSFLFAGNLTKTSTKELISSLSFSVKKTTQTDSNFCPQVIFDKSYTPTDEEWNHWFGETYNNEEEFHESTDVTIDSSKETTENKEVLNGQ